MEVSRRELWDVIKNVRKQDWSNELQQFIRGKIKTGTIDENQLKLEISRFTSKVESKYEKARHNKKNFLESEEMYLSGTFPLTFWQKNENPGTSGNSGPGRPKKSFESLGASAKRKRVLLLTSQYEPEELMAAATFQQDTEVKCSCVKPLPLSGDEAVALLSQARLTKDQYLYLRLLTKKHNADIFPSYDVLLQAKKRCYPVGNNGEEAMFVSEKRASIPLQNIVDHTVKRLAEGMQDVLATREEEKVCLLWKYGRDGSSDHAAYKQVTEEPLLESNIIFTAAVPLQLFEESVDGPKLLWQNPRPSSTRFCRPIELEFGKETREVVLAKAADLYGAIKNIKETTIQLPERANLHVSHSFVESMIDGKVLNILTESSDSNCNVCGATRSIINDLEKVKGRPVREDTLKFGIPPLHCLLRTLTLMLSVAYRLSIRKSHERYTEREKAEIAESKVKIQESLREKIGITVDKPRSGGKGNTNDGNCARRFFDNPGITSSCTGLDFDLLEQLRVVLLAISTTYAVDINAFKVLCEETAQNYVSLYGWYPMSPTVHKMLVHGHQFMAVAPVPLGLLSEEPLECRHKDLRYFRLHHTRKCSRKNGNEDLMHNLLISSDPVIESLKNPPPKKKYGIDSKLLKLLQTPNFPNHQDTTAVVEDSDPDSDIDDPQEIL